MLTNKQSVLTLLSFIVTQTLTVLNIWNMFVLFHSDGLRFVVESWFTVWGGCTLSAAQRGGGSGCTPPSSWGWHVLQSPKSGDVFSGWRSITGWLHDSLHHHHHHHLHQSLWQWRGTNSPRKLRTGVKLSPDLGDSPPGWEVGKEEREEKRKKKKKKRKETFLWWIIVKVE